MVKSVFLEIRSFLAYYLMVMITFGLIILVVFEDYAKDCFGLGLISYILMSFRIVWGEGSFDISETDEKIIAWILYMLLMIIGNIILLNFLIAAVN